MSKRLIVVGVMVLSVVAGAAVPMLGQPSAGREQAAITPAPVTTIPPPRYQVIADIATMQSDIAQLQRDVRDLRNQVDALVLLRAHDVQFNERARAQDLRRVISLEWNVNRLWECAR